MFNDLDYNKDQYISISELKRGLKGKMLDEEIYSVFEQADLDNN